MGDKIKKKERKKEEKKIQSGKVRNPLSLQQSGENRQGSSSTSRVWNRFVGTFSLISLSGKLGARRDGGVDKITTAAVISRINDWFFQRVFSYQRPQQDQIEKYRGKRYKGRATSVDASRKSHPQNPAMASPSYLARTPPSVFCGV